MWKKFGLPILSYCPRPKVKEIKEFFFFKNIHRVIGQQVHYKFFKYQPKNRAVTNTFKITNPVNTIVGNQLDRHFNNVDRTNSMTNIKYLNPKTIESEMTLPNFYKTSGNLKFSIIL